MVNVVISGASRGLGRALAQEMTARGHKVFGGTRTEIELDDSIERFELNVRDEGLVDQAIDRIGQHGPIDILINNAGIYQGGSLEDVSQEDFKKVLDVNLLGAWRVTRAALRHMQAGGAIGMISSLSGLVGLAGDGPYAASKFALEGMSQSLAEELADRRIRVLLFEPGAISTGFGSVTLGTQPEEIAAEIADALIAPKVQLHYPVGDQAREVARKIGLDVRVPGSRLMGKRGE